MPEEKFTKGVQNVGFKLKNCMFFSHVNAVRTLRDRKYVQSEPRNQSKAQDYRFMPEPNLPPLHVHLEDEKAASKDIVSVPSLMKTMPVLPNEMRKRLRRHKLTHQDVYTLVNMNPLRIMFERILTSKPSRNVSKVAHIITVEFLTFVNRDLISLDQCDENLADKLGEIVDLLEDRKINLICAKQLMQEIIDGNELSPTQVVQKNNWYQIVEVEELKKLCLESIERNPNLINQWKSTPKDKAREKLVQKFMEDIKNATNGRADLKTAKVILKELLKEVSTNSS